MMENMYLIYQKLSGFFITVISQLSFICLYYACASVYLFIADVAGQFKQFVNRCVNLSQLFLFFIILAVFSVLVFVLPSKLVQIRLSRTMSESKIDHLLIDGVFEAQAAFAQLFLLLVLLAIIILQYALQTDSLVGWVCIGWVADVGGGLGVQFEEVLFGVALTIADDVLSTVVNVLVTVVIPVPVAVEAVMVGLAFVLLVRTLITIAVNFGVRAMVYVPVIVIAHAIVTVYVNVIASIIITVVHTGIVHRGIAYCAFIGPIDFIIHPININLIEISINIGISIGDTHINTIPVLALVSGKGSQLLLSSICNSQSIIRILVVHFYLFYIYPLSIQIIYTFYYLLYLGKYIYKTTSRSNWIRVHEQVLPELIEFYEPRFVIINLCQQGVDNLGLRFYAQFLKHQVQLIGTQ